MNVLLNDALLRDEARRMAAALSHALPAEAEEPSGACAERAVVLLRRMRQRRACRAVGRRVAAAVVTAVLALGMMIAVIMSWSVDFATPSSSMKELNNAKTMSEKEVQEVNSDDSLQEKGTVYQDPDTGKFYVRVDE